MIEIKKRMSKEEYLIFRSLFSYGTIFRCLRDLNVSDKITIFAVADFKKVDLKSDI